jgi:hypothetical protein
MRAQGKADHRQADRALTADFTSVGATPKLVGRCPGPDSGGTLTGWLADGCSIIQCREITDLDLA